MSPNAPNTLPRTKSLDPQFYTSPVPPPQLKIPCLSISYISITFAYSLLILKEIQWCPLRNFSLTSDLLWFALLATLSWKHFKTTDHLCASYTMHHSYIQFLLTLLPLCRYPSMKYNFNFEVHLCRVSLSVCPFAVFFMERIKQNGMRYTHRHGTIFLKKQFLIFEILERYKKILAKYSKLAVKFKTWIVWCVFA